MLRLKSDYAESATVRAFQTNIKNNFLLSKRSDSKLVDILRNKFFRNISEQQRFKIRREIIINKNKMLIEGKENFYNSIKVGLVEYGP